MLQATNQAAETTVSIPADTTTTAINPASQIPADDNSAWVQPNPIVPPTTQAPGKTFI